MRLPALTKPLALAAALTITLAACGDKTNEPSPSGSASSTPAISMPAPDGFNTSKPVLAPTALAPEKPTDASGNDTALSPDGTHLATWTIDGTTVKITEYDLTTGDKTEHKPYEDLLAYTGEKPDVQVRYTSDDQLSLLTHGTTKGEGASEDTDKWRVVTYNSGKKSDPQTIEQEGKANFEDRSFGAIVAIPAAAGSTDLAYVDVANGTVATESEQPLEGCTNSAKCEVPVRPSVVASDIPISSYEQQMALAGAKCGNDPKAPGGGCLNGFRTDSWTSADPGIAPEGSLPTYAVLAGTDGKFVLGAWATPDNSTTLYRIIDPAHPTDDNGSFTVKDSAPGPTPGARLNYSPDHKHLTVGRLTADLDAKTGVEFGDAEGTKPVVFGGVSDEGTAWGAMSADEGNDQVSASLPWAPSSKAITATSGTATSKSIDGEVNLPVQVITTPNGPAGVFIDNKAAGGKPAVAVYPVG